MGISSVKLWNENYLASSPMNRAVFIDRDDTINKDVPYCKHPDEFELLPKVAEGIKLLNEHGFKIIVVTNQSGIARGYFSEEMLQKIHEKMINELEQKGAFIDAIYYCPHHPDDNCDCRKPKPGLILRAANEHNIDLKRSFMVGDKLEDVEAGKRAGCMTVLVRNKSRREKEDLDLEEGDIKPDFSCPDLYQAAKWITNQRA